MTTVLLARIMTMSRIVVNDDYGDGDDDDDDDDYYRDDGDGDHPLGQYLDDVWDDDDYDHGGDDDDDEDDDGDEAEDDDVDDQEEREKKGEDWGEGQLSAGRRKSMRRRRCLLPKGAHAILGCRIELPVPRTTCLQLRSLGFKVLWIRRP